MYRDHTKVVHIGDRVIGGGNPVLIQSMTNTQTEDVAATVAQIQQTGSRQAARSSAVRFRPRRRQKRSARSKNRSISRLWQTSILIISWRLLPWKTEQIRSASIRAISEALRACEGCCGSWQRSGISQSVSASTAVLWKKIWWRNTMV